MNKMCLAYLGALLLTLHLISSQVVQAQTTQTGNATDFTSGNMTTAPKDDGCGTTATFTLLLPLTAAACLLLGWS